MKRNKVYFHKLRNRFTQFRGDHFGDLCEYYSDSKTTIGTTLIPKSEWIYLIEVTFDNIEQFAKEDKIGLKIK